MKFIIRRASDSWDSKAKPCDEAIKIGEDWVVEINSLEKLQEFINREGRVIVYPEESGVGSILIYDYWIE